MLTAHRPLEEKVQIIQDLPLPSSQRKLLSFLDVVNFYHRFSPNAAIALQLLTELLATGKHPEVFRWSKPTLSNFHTIKGTLAIASFLIHPKPGVPIRLMVDASEVVMA